MVSPIQIQMQKSKRGLYESFDFRGISADGRYAFVLKHTLFTSWLGQGTIEVVMHCIDRKTGKKHALIEHEVLSSSHEKQLNQANNWDNCVFSFASGSFFDISREVLRGKLHTEQGSISWHFNLRRSDEVFSLLPQTWLYYLPWPRHKMQIRDFSLTYHGKIQLAGQSWTGEFLGTNHHYWGDGYPYEFAAAQCSHFDEDVNACFYGFSTRLSVGKWFKTPYLSMAALKLHGRWYYFNELRYCVRHSLDALDNYRWRISFVNADYGLDVEIDGSNPRILPWLAWQVEQPLGLPSVVKATEFAQGTLTLYKRSSMAVMAELHSASIELKTLLPENIAEGQGFWQQA